MKFQVPLPIEPLYCPRLSCQVYDQVFGGFSQPIIGNFTIPIGDLIHELAAERKSEIEALRTMVQTLHKIAVGEERASLLAKSMRGMVENQMSTAGATEAQLASVRMTPDVKKKIVTEFSAKRTAKHNGMIEEEKSGSINVDEVEETQALLTGDSNEEIRMQDRLIEKEQNASQGKAYRVTAADIRPSQ